MVREVETSLPEGPLQERLRFLGFQGDGLGPALLARGSSLLAQGRWGCCDTPVHLRELN